MKMKHLEALRILGLTGLATRDDIKFAYRHLCKHYHPDRNPAGLEMMKLINGAYQALSDFVTGSINTEQDEKEFNYDVGEELNIALNVIHGLGLTIEICGSWIWVSGDTRSHKDILKNAGYKWAPKKKMWSYGTTKSSSRGKYSMDDIRNRHGSLKVKSYNHNRLSA